MKSLSQNLSRVLRVGALGSVVGFAACGSPTVDGPLGGVPPGMAPDLLGPFSTCSVTPKSPLGVPLKPLVLYLPRTSDTTPCEVALGSGRPLALLYPAIGPGNDWASYAVLGEHLASHGIVLASLAASVGLSEAIEFFGEIGMDPELDVGLIGHSAGGDRMVQRRGQVAAAGGSVKAMVLMAPRVSTDPFFDYSLSGVEALLALHWIRDNDSATWGAVSQGVRRSVFRIYDRAGIDFGNPLEATLWKHFAFFDWGGHFRQDEPGLVAYVTSVLRRQLLGDTAQDIFLRSMLPIEGLSPAERPVSQQHSRQERIRIATFEEDPAMNPSIYRKVFAQGVTFSAGPAIVPAWSDPFSPHDLGVARFQFVSEPGIERSLSILFSDEQTIDVSRQTHLSFRVSQEYHPDLAPDGGPVGFDVSLQTPGDSLVPVEDHGGELGFPVVASVFLSQSGEEVDATKNAMRTYLVPLAAFEGADLTRVGAIRFDFSRAQNVPGRRMFFVLDDVEFVD